MKKIFIITLLILAMTISASAAENGVLMEYHRKSKSSNTQVRRTPMYLPIEVIYDSESQTIKIIGDETIVAEVYVYDMAGNLEGFSSSLNTYFVINTPGTHYISIQGLDWEGIGEVVI